MMQPKTGLLGQSATASKVTDNEDKRKESGDDGGSCAFFRKLNCGGRRYAGGIISAVAVGIYKNGVGERERHKTGRHDVV